MASHATPLGLQGLSFEVGTYWCPFFQKWSASGSKEVALVLQATSGPTSGFMKNACKPYLCFSLCFIRPLDLDLFIPMEIAGEFADELLKDTVHTVVEDGVHEVEHLVAHIFSDPKRAPPLESKQAGESKKRSSSAAFQPVNSLPSVNNAEYRPIHDLQPRAKVRKLVARTGPASLPIPTFPQEPFPKRGKRLIHYKDYFQRAVPRLKSKYKFKKGKFVKRKHFRKKRHVKKKKK